MVDAQMKKLWWRFWWANRSFQRPGLYVWTFHRNIRIVPIESNMNMDNQRLSLTERTPAAHPNVKYHVQTRTTMDN